MNTIDQNKVDQLRQSAIDAFGDYLKAEQELSKEGNGFIDKKHIEKLHRAQLNFNKAQVRFENYVRYGVEEI